MLTADASPIMDTDGLPTSSFTYQWIRVDADGTSNPVDITDATAETYTLTDDDEGKKVKVKVSFTDNLSGEEERTSAAYPSSGTVTAAGTTNTAPTAANNTVTTGEDRPYAFDGGRLRLHADTDTGDTLASVKIVTVPTPASWRSTARRSRWTTSSPRPRSTETCSPSRPCPVRAATTTRASSSR